MFFFAGSPAQSGVSVAPDQPGSRLFSNPDFILSTDSGMQALLETFLKKNFKIGAMPTSLCKIMYEENSDKSNGHHNYTQVYDYLFGPIRKKVKNMFELGILNCGGLERNIPGLKRKETQRKSGGSLMGWRRYFPKAQIYGGDFNKDLLFNDEKRIKTFFANIYDNGSMKNMWSEVNQKMDIIVEDGPHTFEGSQKFIDASYKYLKPGGFFIVEDLCCAQFSNSLDDRALMFFNHMKKKRYPGAIIKLPVEEEYNNIHSNVLAVIQKPALPVPEKCTQKRSQRYGDIKE